MRLIRRNSTMERISLLICQLSPCFRKDFMKSFRKQGLNWQINNEIRSMVEFRRINLIERWPIYWPIDIVMLRNVLFYFEIESRKKILESMVGVLAADGHMFLGS